MHICIPLRSSRLLEFKPLKPDPYPARRCRPLRRFPPPLRSGTPCRSFEPHAECTVGSQGSLVAFLCMSALPPRCGVQVGKIVRSG
ncbi:hypothetical protein K432DRAFT_387615, partial [Lepidopterella palustris CBS 459.81]